MSAEHALGAARALARGGDRLIVPVDAVIADELAGGILLVDRAPDDALLAELARRLPEASAAVLWCEGWDASETMARLSAHGLEHGAIEILPGDCPGALCVLVADERTAAGLPARLAPGPRPFRPLAIMPVFNEADVIDASLAALISEGVDVYLIDHESTDDTVALARRWLGRGLRKIERFPEEAGYPSYNRGTMVWRDILTRVQEVSGEVPADWYLFVNADEFREAPWPQVTLADGLREVDELGYSAVNFEVFDFRAVDDDFLPGTDPRAHFTHFERGARYDQLQIKAWKRQPRVVDLAGHGGHDVTFEGRCVFPVPFILRHYAIRSSEHGRRKVLAERLPRFNAQERAGGWHVQYDHFTDDSSFLFDRDQLVAWNPDRARAELLSHAVGDLLLGLRLSGADRGLGVLDPQRLRTWSAARGRPEDVTAAHGRLTAAAQGLRPAPDAGLDDAARDLARALSVGAKLAGDLRGAGQIADAAAALATPVAAPAARTDGAETAPLAA